MNDPARRQNYKRRKAFERRRRQENQEFLEEENTRLYRENFRLRRIIEELNGCTSETEGEDLYDLQSDTEIDVEMSDTIEEDFDDPVESEDDYLNVIKERLEEHPNQFYNFIGLAKEDLISLFQRCINIFAQYKQNGDLLTREYTEGKYRDIDQLFISLFWYRNGDTFVKVGIIFGIHERTIKRIIHRTTRVLYDAVSDDLKWPTDEEFEESKEKFKFFKFNDFEKAVCAIDGSEFRVPRKRIEGFYSGKKKQYALNVMFITLLNGQFIYHSNLRPGANDQREFNSLGIRTWFIGKDYGVLGDAGFTFNRNSDNMNIFGYCPRKKPKNGRLTSEDIDYNTRLSKSRVVIENAIRQLKKWNVLSGKLSLCTNRSLNLDFYYKVIRICVVLTNQKIKRKPLRADNWNINNYRN